MALIIIKWTIIIVLQQEILKRCVDKMANFMKENNNKIEFIFKTNIVNNRKMEHVFAILRAIIMTYNEHNITGYKCYMYDGLNPFIKTKDAYILYFDEGSPQTLDVLFTPYGRIKVSCGFMEDSSLYQIIYDKILMRIGGVFITPTTMIIKRADEITIPYPLIMTNTQYTTEQIKNLFCPLSTSLLKNNEYNSEIERLVLLGTIKDDLDILNNIVLEQDYYDAIDRLFKIKMYSSDETNYFRKTSKVKTKYEHILGLLLLTDTPIKGLTY